MQNASTEKLVLEFAGRLLENAGTESAGPENAETKNDGIENASPGIFWYWKIPVVQKILSKLVQLRKSTRNG